MPAKPPPPGYLSRPQAARQLSIVSSTLRDWAARGVIPFINRGTYQFFAPDDVSRLLTLLAAYPLSAAQTAAMLELDVATVRSWAQRDLLEHRLIGGTYHFHESSIKLLADKKREYTVSLKDAARLLGMSALLVRRRARTEEVEYLQWGHTIYFRPPDIRGLHGPVSMAILLTRSETADLLGVTPETVTQYRKAGLLTNVSGNASWPHYSQTEVEELRVKHRNLTTGDVQKRLGVSQKTVYNLTKNGQLPYTIYGKRQRRYTEADVQKLVVQRILRPGLLTAGQVAARLGVNYRTVYWHATTGLLASIQDGERGRLFTEAGLAEFRRVWKPRRRRRS